MNTADILRFFLRRRWLIRAISPVMGTYNPFHPDYRANPYPTYAKLRDEAPVYRHPLSGIWVLSRHADVQFALKDPRFSVSRSLADATISGNPLSNMNDRQRSTIKTLLTFLDPPDHTRIRSLAHKALNLQRVEGLRPQVQQIADEIFRQIKLDKEFDLMRDFAIPFPLRVITKVLGVPSGDVWIFKKWSTNLTTLLDPINGQTSVEEAISAFDELNAYLIHLLKTRKSELKGDILSALLSAHEEEGSLSEIELIALVALFLVAGHETVTSFIGNSVLVLAQHPTELERLREDASLIESAVEELLRISSPLQATHRMLTEDAEIGGVTLRRGSVVLCLLGSANNDARVFKNPEDLNISRAPNPHLTFGFGIHYCLGAQLARIECQIALSLLLKKFDGQFDVRRECVTWNSSVFFRGPRNLPMTR